MDDGQAPQGSTGPAERPYGSLTAAISNRLVQMHKECYGRGPTKARTYWQDDVITVVLRGGLTAAEQTLHRNGQGEAVLTQRHAFQEAMRERFKSSITELTGRRVEGFFSAAQLEPPMAVEVFVLEPPLAGHAAAEDPDVDRVRTQARHQRTEAEAQRASARESRALATAQLARSRV
jgi:uncharacterized protein YbcI